MSTKPYRIRFWNSAITFRLIGSGAASTTGVGAPGLVTALDVAGLEVRIHRQIEEIRNLHEQDEGHRDQRDAGRGQVQRVL